MEKVHEEDGVGPEMLAGDVLYYGDHHSLVVQLHSKEDAQALVNEHKGKDGKLIVLDVGLKHCGPCVKVMSEKTSQLFMEMYRYRTCQVWYQMIT